MIAHHTPVVRVICASVSLVRGSVMQELLEMRQVVSAFNLAHDVRSALLYSSGWIFQWHEGPVAGVEKALHVAQADRRHDRMRILHRSVGMATLSEPLQISTTHNLDKPTDVARRLFRLEQSQALEGQAEPSELWMQLAAPRSAPGPGRAESMLVQRHVVAVTSNSTGAVDLVRSIGDRVGEPVTYQRFATGAPRAADVGAVYVDLPGSFHVLRLQALSQRSLTHPLVRLLMQDVQCVLLLMGDRDDSNLALAREVALLLGRVAAKPSLRLAVGDQGNTQAVRACFQNCSGDIADIDPLLLWQAGPEALFRSLLGARQGRESEAAAQPG